MLKFMGSVYNIILKWRCCQFDDIFITDCTGSCQNDNFQCSQWQKCRQNDDISVNWMMISAHTVKVWANEAIKLYIYAKWDMALTGSRGRAYTELYNNIKVRYAFNILFAAGHWYLWSMSLSTAWLISGYARIFLGPLLPISEMGWTSV